VSSEPFDILTLTDEAREMVSSALASEDRSNELALWVEVTGTQGSGYSYDLYFSEVAQAPEGAAIGVDGEIQIVIPAASVDRLRGARLEFANDGLVLVNPNQPSSDELHPGIPEAILAHGTSGELALVAIRVLDENVNPSIASHGGRCDLVALDEGNQVAYVMLSGGCQGCAMSRMTLSDGIEKMLREEIPALKEVVDVTDHASGVNPFYAHS
jgi:Fe/S biogenesis protein NfuA